MLQVQPNLPDPSEDATTGMQNVFITVAGGVAYVAEVPDSVRVHIIDYDDLRDDFQFAFGRLSPEEQAFYWRLEEALPRLPPMGNP